MRAAPAMLVVTTLLLAGCYGPTSALDSYLRAAAGGESDRGWRYLGGAAQASYDGDMDAYIADATAADWGHFEWRTPAAGWSDDGFTMVHADVLSGPASVPAFLIEHSILSGDCQNGEPDGVYVFHHADPFHDEINAGGLTGSQMRCNSEYIGDAAFEE